ncbi:MAG TPA: chloride channel protein [Candidatus Binataceae bacterium]|nr:chloride channel protein [Candidatus Binataceae bacterium]
MPGTKIDPSKPKLGLRTDQFNYVQMILLASVVGMLAALGNLGFRALIHFSDALFRGLEWNALGINLGGVHLALIPLILASGAAGMLLLDRFFRGDVLGYGFPHFLEQVNLGNARIKRGWIFVKAAGAALSLGSGWSVGREGPIAQVGGAIGSAVAQFRKLGPERAKVLVAAGAGAGIATTFNAPMGGLMFAQEIVLLGHTELANLTLLIVATLTAVVTSRAVTGNDAVFQVPQFVLRSYWEMLTYGAMGAVFGVLAAGYIRFFHETADRFRRLNLMAWQKLAIGAAIVGTVAIFLPQNLSDGYPTINAAMAGQHELAILAALTFAKMFTSSVSLGSGAPGGVFGPIFFIGTMAGGTAQRAFNLFIPHLTGPRGSYALVGLGAFLAGTTHAPLTALFLLFEMTQNYTVALPAMIATIAALVVARQIEAESIDTYRLAREGKTLHIAQERLALSQIPVRAVMDRDVVTVAESTTFDEVLRIAGETSQSTLPVVSSTGNFTGLIITRDLLALIVREESLSPLVNAYDLCERNPPLILPDATLDAASEMMGVDGLEEVPVADRSHEGQFLGLVTRRHVAQALNRVALSLTSIARGDSNISWASGYRVTRAEVPRAAVGQTLRTLDPRARFSVTVLALRDVDDPESGFVPIAPDRALKAGDLLVIAGRASDLRRFTRALSESNGKPATAQ